MSLNASKRHLANQLKDLHKNPSGYFYVELKDESNLYEWKVYLKGPEATPYEGGIFQAELLFPKNYPYHPPTMRFLSEIWHPNVYKDGKVCISILHPPVDDEMSGESAGERWLPIHTAETILISVISMLSDPNCSSPANVDAGVEWRQRKQDYVKKVSKLVAKSLKDLPDNFQIPQPKKKVEEVVNSYEYDEAQFEYDMEDEDEDDFSEDGELSDLNEEELKMLENDPDLTEYRDLLQHNK